MCCTLKLLSLISWSWQGQAFRTLSMSYFCRGCFKILTILTLECFKLLGSLMNTSLMLSIQLSLLMKTILNTQTRRIQTLRMLIFHLSVTLNTRQARFSSTQSLMLLSHRHISMRPFLKYWINLSLVGLLRMNQGLRKTASLI